MRSLLLALGALATGSAAPPTPPAPARGKPPCEKPVAHAPAKPKGGLVQSDKPNAAQRVIPGLF